MENLLDDLGSPERQPFAGPDAPPADAALAALVRLRGAPLLDALEQHLPGSRDHAEATGAHAFAAAVGIGLDRAAADLCREAAKLHDVGMVYVPVAVTQTHFESWTDEQRALFDAHYEAGAKLALGAGIPDDVCGWLLQIRERFDGQGPRACRGCDPGRARIARAACACDTLLASPAGRRDAGRAADAADRPRPPRARARSGVVDALAASVPASLNTSGSSPSVRAPALTAGAA